MSRVISDFITLSLVRIAGMQATGHDMVQKINVTRPVSHEAEADDMYDPTQTDRSDNNSAASL